MYGEQARFFDDEIKPHLKHKKRGTVAMASGGKNLNASQVWAGRCSGRGPAAAAAARARATAARARESRCQRGVHAA
jgi:hypothetical protein